MFLEYERHYYHRQKHKRDNRMQDPCGQLSMAIDNEEADADTSIKFGI